LPELLVVVLIAHRLKELNRYLRTTEMVIEIGDKGIRHRIASIGSDAPWSSDGFPHRVL
jgi:hypothetical protein